MKGSIVKIYIGVNEYEKTNLHTVFNRRFGIDWIFFDLLSAIIFFGGHLLSKYVEKISSSLCTAAGLNAEALPRMSCKDGGNVNQRCRISN